MKRKQSLLFGAVAFLILILVSGFWLYNWVLGETESASEPISAPTLAVVNPAAATQPVAITGAPVIEPTAALPTAAQTSQNNNTASASTAIYEISQDGSEARFTIYELLRGSPKDVVGVTSQVAGQAALDLTDLSTAKVGEILINARTLATDDDRRNQAIRNRILFTDQYEFIRFTPTRIIGLQGTAEVGKPFTFQVEGDLTIRDVTKTVVFELSITGETTDRMSGTAKAVIKRADFNLNIPDVPFVADVGEEITLEIDLVLLAE